VEIESEFGFCEFSSALTDRRSNMDDVLSPENTAWLEEPIVAGLRLWQVACADGLIDF
jgi:hypothetical protein